MKEKILDLISIRNGRITFRELKEKLNIDTISLENLLLELKLDGKVLQVSNKYRLFPDNLLIGDISTTLSGNKVVFYDGMKIPLASNFFDAVLYNDVVAFRINEDNMAEVVSIIDRRIKNITCEVVVEDGVKKIIPYHKGIKISLDKKDMKELLDGEIILVDIDINSDDEYCNARLVKKLSFKSSPNRNEIEAAINYGFDNDYSDEYMEELAKIPRDISQEDLSYRTDFRKLKTMTIDGANTKDMDDGLSGRMLPNGWIEVYVHIVDLSHLIKPNSKLFERACEKTTSAYINNSVFPMFHPIISNGIGSLNQGEDRLTKTVIAQIDEFGEVHNVRIVKSIINSDKKMTYDNVEKILTGEEIPEGYENFVNEINILNEASIRIRKRMENNGTISFANNELEKEYDNDGKLIEYHEMGEVQSRKLIEYLMILANVEVAKYIYYSPLPGVFRIHEFPELRKVNEAIKTVNGMGKRIKKLKSLSSSFDLQKIQKQIQNDEDYKTISTFLLRFMKRARYSINNLGHFALALDAYCHFTSPIRRLPDLLVHRILDILLMKPELVETIDTGKMEVELEKLCVRSSFMERQADRAAKEAQDHSIIENMSKDIGEEFECTVLDVGSLIKIRINSVDVTVKPDCLSHSFKYVKKKKMYYDFTNDLYLKPGTKVIARLNSVDTVNKKLNLTILNIIDQKVLVKKNRILM